MKKLLFLLPLLLSCEVKDNSNHSFKSESILIENTERYYVRINETEIISVDELVHLVQEYEYKLSVNEINLIQYKQIEQ